MMRHTAVYDTKDQWQIPIQALQLTMSKFENLINNLSDVKEGFPRQIELTQLQNRAEYNSNALLDNLVFGTPDQVVKKLRKYEALGVDEFTYYANTGMGFKEQKRSLQLFINEVMPAFS